MIHDGQTTNTDALNAWGHLQNREQPSQKVVDPHSKRILGHSLVWVPLNCSGAIYVEVPGFGSLAVLRRRMIHQPKIRK